jgi:hypothetical protein
MSVSFFIDSSMVLHYVICTLMWSFFIQLRESHYQSNAHSALNHSLALNVGSRLPGCSKESDFGPLGIHAGWTPLDLQE